MRRFAASFIEPKPSTDKRISAGVFLERTRDLLSILERYGMLK